jgi:hypothetical protein
MGYMTTLSVALNVFRSGSDTLSDHQLLRQRRGAHTIRRKRSWRTCTRCKSKWAVPSSSRSTSRRPLSSTPSTAWCFSTTAGWVVGRENPAVKPRVVDESTIFGLATVCRLFGLRGRLLSSRCLHASNVCFVECQCVSIRYGRVAYWGPGRTVPLDFFAAQVGSGGGFLTLLSLSDPQPLLFYPLTSPF